jgi:hypothetical protein
MNDDFDPKDILLEATADIQEIMREVLADLTAPQVLAKIMESWATAPDELKEQFAQEHPEEYRELMKMIDEGKKERKVSYATR